MDSIMIYEFYTVTSTHFGHKILCLTESIQQIYSHNIQRAASRKTLAGKTGVETQYVTTHPGRMASRHGLLSDVTT